MNKKEGKNEENNLKKNERSEKGDHIFSSKNERRSKQGFFFFKKRTHTRGKMYKNIVNNEKREQTGEQKEKQRKISQKTKLKNRENQVHKRSDKFIGVKKRFKNV